MTSPGSIRGKITLVTGAGSGIGRASAQAFAEAGAVVVVADIDERAGGETVGHLESLGATASYRHVDVADEGSVRELIAGIMTEHGRLDIAHNNAGVEGKVVPLAEVPSDDFERVMRIDLFSVFYCMKAEIAVMLEQGGGVICNTASASGLIGGYNLSTYTAAKHGVVGMTKAAAMDYARRGIRINAVCPGTVDTPFVGGLPTEFRDRLDFGTPLGRHAQPAEIGRAVRWLCSDDASYMIGHALPVDGGVVLGGVGTRFDDLVEATPDAPSPIPGPKPLPPVTTPTS